MQIAKVPVICTAQTSVDSIVSTMKEISSTEDGIIYDFKDKYLNSELAEYKQKRVDLFAAYRLPVHV